MHDEYLRLDPRPGRARGLRRPRSPPPPAPAAAGPPMAGAGRSPRPPAGRRRRRRQGGTRAEQALQVVRQNPGITVSELAGRLGIAQANYLYRVMNGLQADGAVRREGRYVAGAGSRAHSHDHGVGHLEGAHGRGVVTGRLHVIGHRLGLTEHGRIAPSTRSAASRSPRWRSIITPESMSGKGDLVLASYFGAGAAGRLEHRVLLGAERSLRWLPLSTIRPSNPRLYTEIAVMDTPMSSRSSVPSLSWMNA